MAAGVGLGIGLSMAEAIVYARHDCHLCDRARAVLDAIAHDYPMTVRVVNVDDAPDLRARFGDRVPVIVVDGVTLAEGRVSEYRLRRALGAAATPRQILGLVRARLRDGVAE